MYQLLKHTLLIILLLDFSFANAQDPYSIHLNKSNGLPSNAVYDVFQDSKGFIWLCTNEGLTRYDGFEYRTYTSPEQTSKSGSSIKEDRYGRIWYENFDGYLYYVANDTLKAFRQQPPITFTPISITQKHIFIFQIDGIDIYDLNNFKLVKHIHTPTANVEYTTSSDKYFYYISSNTIYRIDENFKIIQSPFLTNPEIAKQIQLKNNKLYITSKYHKKKQIYIFNEDLSFFANIHAPEIDLIQNGNIIDDALWLNSPKGTFAYSLSTHSCTIGLFKEKSISCVLKDKQDNYWFGTTNEGIYLVPDLNNLVYTFSNFLPSKIVETKGNFIIATKKGELLSCDKNLNIKNIINQKKDNSAIYYLYYDSTNNDLFFSSNGGFSQLSNLNPQNLSFQQIALKEMVGVDQDYYAFAVSGFCGLMKRRNTNPTSVHSSWDSIYRVYSKPNINNVISLIDGVRGKSVAFNSKNNAIYFATNLGLFKCSPTNTQEIKKNGLSFYATKIIFHANEIYALCTKGNFYRIRNEKEFILLNFSYNLSEFEVKFIKKIDHNIVFLSNSSAYILNLNTQQYSKINININDYETNDVFIQGDKLLLATNSGIIQTTIHPSNFRKKNGVSLQLNDLIVSNKKFDPWVRNTFGYDQNNMTIHFSILDFGNSNIHQVFYRVNKGKWKLISNESRVIDFTTLAPGFYSIEFKLDSNISNQKVEFTITTPFWQTTWFFLFSFFALLGIGFLYYRLQLNKLRIQNKLLEDKNILLQEKIELEHSLNKSVLTSIKSQMNPHFFYNALNTIQAYIFTNDKSKANSYLAKFSKLTRLILEQSEKETISLGEEIESLTLYLELEKMRFKENFEYILEEKYTSSKEDIELPPMIIQPYVENAIKHGLLHKTTERKLHLIFEENAAHLIVTIDDNGIGRKRSAELNKIKNEKYQSFSSQANEKRLEILNRGTNNKVAFEIIDKISPDGVAMGTKVILKIPI